MQRRSLPAAGASRKRRARPKLDAPQHACWESAALLLSIEEYQGTAACSETRLEPLDAH
jgi:hypothetical protein